MTHPAQWIGQDPAITRVNNAETERWQDTNWEQIVLLCDMQLHLAPSPVTRLHRAIAVRYTAGTRAAMAELDDPAERAVLQQRLTWVWHPGRESRLSSPGF